MSDCIIVIPCYNEAGRLNLAAFINYVARHDRRLLFVDDGSTDATAEVLSDLVTADRDRLSVVHLPENRGKAEAVRQGIQQALEMQPRYFGYWDADLATPLEAINEFADYLDAHDDVEILLGARVRLLGRHIERHTLRHCLGRLFATAAAATLRLPVYDTQCGAKLFRANGRTRALFDEPFLTRWLFDVELLARYLSLGGERTSGPAPEEKIHEFALSEWRDVAGSKVKPTDFLRAIWQLGVIRRTYRKRTTVAGETEPGPESLSVKPHKPASDVHEIMVDEHPTDRVLERR